MFDDHVPDFDEEDILDYNRGLAECFCGRSFLVLAPSDKAIVPCPWCETPCEVDLDEFVINGTMAEAFEAVGIID